MTGKLIAGVVCGAAAAWPGRFFLGSILSSLAPLLGNGDDLESSLMVAPFAVAGLVIAICLIAPNTVGAWLRGCLMVTVVSAMTTVQTAQCLGLGWLFGEVFDDRLAREAAMAGCPEGLTPLASTLIAFAAVGFGIAALLVWRGARRGQEL